MDLLNCFSGLNDPRRSQGLRTPLPQLLTMAIFSICCGHTGYRGISRFCKAHSDSLTELLGLAHAVPSYVTFRDVLTRISQKEFTKVFNRWASGLQHYGTHPWLSSDGKALRSTVSHSQDSGQDFQAIVSMFCKQSGLVYSLESYQNKSKEKGEQDIVRYLVGQLELKGAIITLDALHAQKND